ncbi:unnamed protein product, partial [Staurois parvus]
PIRVTRPPHIWLSLVGNPWRTPLPLTGVLSRGDLVSGYYKSIPTIRGPGEQVPWGLDSALWARLTVGVLVVPLGGPSQYQKAMTEPRGGLTPRWTRCAGTCLP